MGLTNIQWCDYTFNAWLGCRKVAPECENCYITSTPPFRFRKLTHGKERVRTAVSTWKQPLAWNNTAICNACGESARIAAVAGNLGKCPKCHADEMRNPRVFCLSLGDWLDDEVPIEWLADLLSLIRLTPNLDWLMLTKRPQNWRNRMERVIGLSCITGCDQDSPHGWAGWLANRWINTNPPLNVWIGVSQGADQKAALDIPAKTHFLSCEPMLHQLIRTNGDEAAVPEFDWVIFGGESGKNARPLNIQWLRYGVNFCRHYGVVPFVKQLGSNCIDTTGKPLRLKDSHGGNPLEWPEDLRVREFPQTDSEPPSKAL